MSEPIKKRGKKPADTLFNCGPKAMLGGIPDTPSDIPVADGVVAQCFTAMEALKKIGPKARLSAIKRIVRALNSVQTTVNCAAFRRVKDAPPEQELFATNRESTSELV